MLAGATILMGILVVALLLFRKYGWSKAIFYHPRYRKLQKRYNMDGYSSKGSTVRPNKKVHPVMLLQQEGTEPPSSEAQQDEFWDYDHQVDMEAFSSRKVYQELADQSNRVIASIDGQKEQAKALFQKLTSESEGLKALWVARLNLKGKAEMASPEDLRTYEKAREEFSTELNHRKELGEQFARLLSSQLSLVESLEESRQSHRVQFDANVREARRTVESLHRVCAGTKENAGLRERLSYHLDSLLDQLSSSLEQESGQRGANSVIGQFTGAPLVSMETGEVISAKHIENAVSTENEDIVIKDMATGLLMPGPSTRIKLHDGSTRRVPANHMIHPKTGHVVPIEGNICYDHISQKLVFTCDMRTTDSVVIREEPLIPFVPYPLSIETGQPVETGLQMFEKQTDLWLGATMKDPATGLHVPICAVTIHPRTHALLPVGGTYKDPVTSLPIPIEIGSMLLDPQTRAPVPTLGVSIDSKTGAVFPVGGSIPMLEYSETHQKPILLGEKYTEPLSQLPVRVTSAYFELEEGALVQTYGGYQTLLDSCELSHEKSVIDSLLYLRDLTLAITHHESDHQEVNLHSEMSKFDFSCKELLLSRSKNQAHYLTTIHSLLQRKQSSDQLASNGGSPGYMEFKATGQPLPLLLGLTIPDPAGTGMQVPILGYEVDSVSGIVEPLGGTMESVHSNQTEPIMMGRPAYDQASRQLAPISGVHRSPESGVVVPTVQDPHAIAGAKKKKQIPRSVLTVFEEEAAARRSFWRRANQLEDEISSFEGTIHQDMLTVGSQSQATSIKQQLSSLEESIHSLYQLLSTENQRRHGNKSELANKLPPDVTHIMLLMDRQEVEANQSSIPTHKRFAEICEKLLGRIVSEAEKYQERMQELKDANNPEAVRTLTATHWERVSQLMTDTELQLASQRTFLDKSHACQAYIRNKAELCVQHAKAILTGTAVVFTGSVGYTYHPEPHPLGIGHTNQLQPLLEHLVQLVESSGLEGLQGDMGAGDMEATTSAEFVSSSSPLRSPLKPARATLQRGMSGTPRKLGVSEDHVEDTGALGIHPTLSTERGVPDTSDDVVMTDPMQKAIAKQLIEKHTIENVQLDNALHNQESERIKQVLSQFEGRKSKAINNAMEELAQKLSDVSDGEKEQLLLDHADLVSELVSGIEEEKRRTVDGLLQELAENRFTRKKELMRTHLEEVQSKGLSSSCLVDSAPPTPDELTRDLAILTQQQERLIAEISAAKAKHDQSRIEREDAAKRCLMNNMMEHRLRLSSVSHPQINAQQEGAKQLDVNLSQRQNSMKVKFQSHMKERRKKRPTTASMLDDSQVDADTLQIQMALMGVIQKDNHITKQRSEKEDLCELVTDGSQQTVLLEQYDKDLQRIDVDVSIENEGEGESDGVIVSQKVAQHRMEEEMKKEQQLCEQLKLSTAKQATLEGQVEPLPEVQADSEEATAERQQLLDSHLQQQVELDQKHRKEQTELDKEVIEEKKRVITSLDEQYQMQQTMQRRDMEFQQQLAKEQRTISVEETDRLIATHREEMAAFQQTMEAEKTQQIKVLADKVAERKKRKADSLVEQQKLETERLLTEQTKARNELESKQARKSEMASLHALLKDRQPGEVESLVYNVLHQRHLRETVQLAAQHEREKALAMEEKKSALKATQQEGRDHIVAEQEKAIVELISKSTSLSKPELAKQKLELKKEHRKQLVEYDRMTQEILDGIPKEVTPERDLHYNEQILALRECQIRELATAMQQLSPEEALTQSYMEEADQAAREAERFRKNVIEARERKIAQLKEEKWKREEERKREREQQLRELEAEIEREKQKDVDREKKLKEKYDSMQQQRLAEQEAIHQRTLMSMGNVSEKERERLLAEHKQAMQKLSETLDQGKDRQLSKLQGEIKKRRQKKKDKRRKQLEEEEVKAARADEEEERKGLLEVNQEQVNQLRKQVETVQPKTPNFARPPQEEEITSEGVQTTPESVLSHSTPATVSVPLSVQLGDQDLSQLILSTPLFGQLSEIESLLQNQLHHDGLGSGVDGTHTQPYIDLKDAQWECKGDLVPVDIQTLRPSDFVVYRFGVFVCQLLSSHNHLPEVTVLLASNLPPNNYSRNCFRNSFFYEHSRKILFVRKDRIDSVGEFVLVIMHCLAHIKAGDLTDDTSTPFLREFYQAITTCCQDLFFARATRPARAPIHQDGSTLLESAFQQTRNWDERMSIVDELVNLRVHAPTNIDFSDETVAERMSTYASYLDKSKIHQLIQTSRTPPKSSEDGDIVSAKLQSLGITSATPKKWADEISPEVLQDPKRLCDLQISRLNHKIDDQNVKLASVLTDEVQLQETLQSLQGEDLVNAVASIREEQATLKFKKENILRKLEQLELEKQEKEQCVAASMTSVAT